MINKDILPDSWGCAKLEEVAIINPPKPVLEDDSEVTFLPMSFVEGESGKYHLAETRKYKEVKKGYTGFKVGDVIFAKITPCMENGKVAFLSQLFNSIGFGSTEFHVVRPSNVIEGRYLFHFLVQKSFRGSAKRNMTGSAGQLRVPKGFLSECEISIPPFPEQRAIVAKIEQLFSELDNGIDNLKKAQEQLKVYRQAVLKKAFEGELTKAWRAKQIDISPAEELLEQIKREREETSNKLGIKLKQFPLIEDKELTRLPLLPMSWAWFYLGNAFGNSPQNGLYKPANLYGEGTDIIRIDNFYEGKLFRNSGFKKVKLSDSEIEKYTIKNGQLLINRVNSIEYLGKCGFVEKLTTPTVFESNIMKLEMLQKFINPKYISLYLTSLLGIQEIRKNAKHAVNQASINQTDVSLTSIPLTTIEEQNQIVQEIETRLSICDKFEETIKESLEKAEALRQSILKKAFEGNLLTEAELAACRKERDWEPAEKLLERIKLEKENAGKTKKKRELA